MITLTFFHDSHKSKKATRVKAVMIVLLRPTASIILVLLVAVVVILEVPTITITPLYGFKM